MKVHCTNCNYQYSPRSGKMPSKCPYCDKQGSIEKIKEMQQWIDEIADEEVEKSSRC
ncbi:hypothetical protein HYU11_05600 [Candidatus Woesearchaeota archaeon]|nr:hypothetical protein [Candidatus Woesearchaeota archaeon]